MNIIIATQNPHKVTEFSACSTQISFEPTPVSIEVDENADSFVGNARLKARAYAGALHRNVIADDSGLCVDALGGAPGIFSARYATLPPDVDLDPDRQAANNRKLLRNLSGRANRAAHFTCALCLVIVEPRDVAWASSNPETRHVATFYDDQFHPVPAGDARAVCAELVFEAQAHGIILDVLSGTGGFGYDPLFFCPQTGCTFASLTREQKLGVSHRGRALAQLAGLFERACLAEDKG